MAMAVATAAVALVEAATATLVDLEASPPGGRGPYCIHLRFFPNHSGKDLSEHITTKAPGCARLRTPRLHPVPRVSFSRSSTQNNPFTEQTYFRLPSSTCWAR